MKLAPNDPMIGFYDRAIAEGKHLELYRKIPVVIMAEIGESFDLHAYKAHCVELGYGSQESMDILFPDSPATEGQAK